MALLFVILCVLTKHAMSMFQVHLLVLNFFDRAVELGLTSEDLIAAEEIALQSEPKVVPIKAKSNYAERLSSKVIV